MAKQLAELPVGSKIVYSGAKYLSDPITWIVVGRDIDGLNTTTLLSEYVLCQKAFHIDGSNNNYATSDIFTWLNSTANTSSYNEAGFLSGFDQKIIEKMLIARQETNPSIENQYVHLMRDTNVFSGSSVYPYFTDNASKIGTLSDDTAVVYYTSYGYSAGGQSAVRCVGTDGTRVNKIVTESNGVRPLIFLNDNTEVSDSVNSDGYYEMIFSFAIPIITFDPEFSITGNFVSLNYEITNAISATVALDDNEATNLTDIESGTYEILEEDFLELAYGNHTVTITALSEDGISTSQSVTFTKINHAPTITIANDLGFYSEPFTITYATDDPEYEEVEVKFYLNSDANYIGDGVNGQFEITSEVFNPLVYSEHTLYIKISDGTNEVTTSTVFSKTYKNSSTKINVNSIGVVEEPFTITFSVEGAGEFFGNIYIDTTLIKHYDTVQRNILYAVDCPEEVFNGLSAGNHSVKIQVSDRKSALVKFKRVIEGVNELPRNKSGKIGFIPSGEFDRLKTYEVLDFIYYNDATYVARRTVEGIKPTGRDDDPNWKKMVYIDGAEEYLVKLDNKSLIWDEDGNIAVNKLYIYWKYVIPYKINHMWMNLDGETYSLHEQTTEEEEPYVFFTPPTKIYPGFTAQEPKQVKLDETLGREVDLNYTRNKYELTVQNNSGYEVGVTADTSKSGSYYFGAPITVSATVKPGYTWTGWAVDQNDTSSDFTGHKGQNPITFTMFASDRTIYPMVSANTNTPYKVRHYWQNTTGEGYTLYETVNLTGTTGATINRSSVQKTYTGLTFKKVDGATTINGDGSSVYEIYYDRKTYYFNVSYNSQQVSINGTTSPGYYRYGATITLRVTENDGYGFDYWESSDQTLRPNISYPNTSFAMPEGNIRLTAKLSARTTYYTVNKYLMTTTGSYPSGPSEQKAYSGTVGSAIVISNVTTPVDGYTYSYCKVNGTMFYGTATTVLANRGRTIDLYYTRNKYQLTVNGASGFSISGSTSSGSYYWGSTITLNATATGSATFDYWEITYNGQTKTSNKQSLTYTMPIYNTTITLHTKAAYTVTFNSNGGSSVSSQSYAAGATMSSLPTPTRSGYTFNGWYDGSTKYTTSSTMPSRNLTLTASWTEVEQYVYIKIYYDTSAGSSYWSGSEIYINGESRGVLKTSESAPRYKMTPGSTITIYGKNNTSRTLYYRDNDLPYNHISGTGTYNSNSEDYTISNAKGVSIKILENTPSNGNDSISSLCQIALLDARMADFDQKGYGVDFVTALSPLYAYVTKL